MRHLIVERIESELRHDKWRVIHVRYRHRGRYDIVWFTSQDWPEPGFPDVLGEPWEFPLSFVFEFHDKDCRVCLEVQAVANDARGAKRNALLSELSNKFGLDPTRKEPTRIHTKLKQCSRIIDTWPPGKFPDPARVWQRAKPVIDDFRTRFRSIPAALRPILGS